MLALTYSNQITGFSGSNDKLAISSMITNLAAEYLSSYHSYTSQRNDWFVKQYPTKEMYLGNCFRYVKVWDMPDTADIRRVGGNFNNLAGAVDVTEEFFGFTDEEVITGHVIKATVIKKGLKSTGQVVTVNHEVGGNAILETTQVKDLLDKMTRVNVTVNGWGRMSLSPDSLDNYESVPVVQKAKIFKFVTEEALSD